jgi:transcriptional regulator with XRE-family HTH domain
MSKLTGQEQLTAQSREKKKANRWKFFTKQISDAGFRHGYLAQHVKTFLAAQIRSLRGEESQIKFGQRLGMKQSVVSRLENSGTTANVQTLIEIANKLELGLIVQFVNYDTFFEWSKNVSEDTLAPKAFSGAVGESSVAQSVTTSTSDLPQLRFKDTKDGLIVEGGSMVWSKAPVKRGSAWLMVGTRAA